MQHEGHEASSWSSCLRFLHASCHSHRGVSAMSRRHSTGVVPRVSPLRAGAEVRLVARMADAEGRRAGPVTARSARQREAVVTRQVARGRHPDPADVRTGDHAARHDVDNPAVLGRTSARVHVEVDDVERTDRANDGHGKHRVRGDGIRRGIGQLHLVAAVRIGDAGEVCGDGGTAGIGGMPLPPQSNVTPATPCMVRSSTTRPPIWTFDAGDGVVGLPGESPPPQPIDTAQMGTAKKGRQRTWSPRLLTYHRSLSGFSQ